jgi:hypothetical protein
MSIFLISKLKNWTNQLGNTKHGGHPNCHASVMKTTYRLTDLCRIEMHGDVDIPELKV